MYDLISAFVTFFEESYNCAGVCQTALFYFGRSVEVGKPTETCIGNLKDAITDEVAGLGIATLVAGILLLFIFICQYCLWYKY